MPDPDPSVLTPGELREIAPAPGTSPGLLLILCLDPFHALDLLGGWARVPRSAALEARPLSAGEADERLDRQIFNLRAASMAARSDIARIDTNLAALESARRFLSSMRRPSCP